MVNASGPAAVVVSNYMSDTVASYAGVKLSTATSDKMAVPALSANYLLRQPLTGTLSGLIVAPDGQTTVSGTVVLEKWNPDGWVEWQSEFYATPNGFQIPLNDIRQAVPGLITFRAYADWEDPFYESVAVKFFVQNDGTLIDPDTQQVLGSLELKLTDHPGVVGEVLNPDQSLATYGAIVAYKQYEMSAGGTPMWYEVGYTDYYSGYYELSGLPDGDLKLEVVPYEGAYFGTETFVTITPGSQYDPNATPQNVNFQLVGPNVTGMVVYPDGTPVFPNDTSTAHVKAQSSDMEWVYFENEINGDGTFGVQLDNGMYDLRAHPDGDLADGFTPSLPQKN
jgi:hypothetical protein